jgi:hypothetical protein
MGENITTCGVDLLSLPTNTLLKYVRVELIKNYLQDIRFSQGAILQVTGLRNPCSKLDKFEQGLKNANLEKNSVCFHSAIVSYFLFSHSISISINYSRFVLSSSHFDFRFSNAPRSCLFFNPRFSLPSC